MANNLQIQYAGGGRRTAASSPKAMKLTDFLARMRADTPAVASEDTPGTAVSGFGLGSSARGAIAGYHPDDAPIAPDEATPDQFVSTMATPQRPVPGAPAVPDISTIDAEEAAKLEAEQGPRVKPNPKGWKGVLLGAVKGLVGLAEGYGRSGARDWHDAVPSMVEGASRRISDYQTNREDSVPFDEERTRRVQERVRPLLQKYGQDKQKYSDAMDRYKIDTGNDADEEARKERDRTFGLQERQVSVAEQYHKDQLAQRSDEQRQRSEIARETARARIQQGLATQRNAQARGQMAARMKHLDGQARRLESMEKQEIDTLRDLNNRKSNPKLAGDAGTLEQINAAITAGEARLDAVRHQRDGLDDQYGSLAAETATADAGGVPGGVAPTADDFEREAARRGLKRGTPEYAAALERFSAKYGAQ